MKKILIPFTIIIISGLIVLNYFSFKSPKEDKIITQLKAYSLFQTEDLNIKLYANRKTAFQQQDAIEVAFISNKDETKKLQIDLLNIYKQNNYEYLEDNYTCYLYQFKLPFIDSYFQIDKTFLTIRLKSGVEETFLIGSFDYYVNDNQFSINELYGTRHTNVPSLKTVSLKLSLNETIYIERIHISHKAFVTVQEYLDDDQLLTIEFLEQNIISDHIALKIVYFIDEQQYTEILPFYLYYETNENPLLYRSLNNVKVLN